MTKSETMSLRLSPELLALLQERAEVRGVAASEFARTILIEVLTSEVRIVSDRATARAARKIGKVVGQ